MVTQSVDTTPQAEEIQIALLRQASGAKRFALACSLSHTTIQLSRRAIQRANPSFTPLELNLAFVQYHYGAELAQRVQTYLAQRHAKQV